MKLLIVVDSIGFQLPITQLPISGVGDTTVCGVAKELVDAERAAVVEEAVVVGHVGLGGVEEHDAVRAGFEQADLVVLEQLHEAGHLPCTNNNVNE